VSATFSGSKLRRWLTGWHRRLSKIWIRLLAFNVLLLFLPAAGVLYLDTFERQLLEAQEQSMVQQGRILAAALATDTELDPAQAERILVGLNQRVTSRLRVIDGEGRLLADSSRLGPRAPGGGSTPEALAQEDPRSNLLYRFGASLFRLYDRITGGPGSASEEREFYSAEKIFDGPEITAALAGRYGAATRVTAGQRSITLFSAIPIPGDAGEPVGAVLVSQSTFRLLGGIYEVRLAVFKVFVGSVVAAVILSLLLGGTIARPLTLLGNEAAALLDRRGRLTGRFGGWRRQDEIGDLARTLEGMARRLEERIGFMESFAADVSHEFKNPLASIRTATELLAEVEEPAQRRRFLRMVERDVARLERLLSAVREVSLIDARLDEDEVEPVDLSALLARWLEGRRLRLPGGVTIASELPAQPLRVQANADRLSQIFENLLDNAFSFAPAGTRVEVTLARQGDEALVRVADRGPGFPPEHLDRIFQRFFSYRPAQKGRDHTGLGLAIVKAIVEGYGGSVEAGNREGGGAQVGVRLPLLV